MEKRFITVLIKPASSACNLACKYCFYNDVSNLREVKSFGMMTNQTAENLITKTLKYANGGGVNYAFQGGEPTLCSIEFFKHFVNFAKENNSKNAKITYSLQTNGTLITDQLASFFGENDFLIGVSIDGKVELHNQNRIYIGGKGSYNKVMQGVDLLNKHKVKYNALTVVNSYSAKKGRETYRFFKSRGINYMQFIDCLEPFDVVPFSSGFALDNEKYFEYYKSVFDEYLRDIKSGENVYVRNFENILAKIQGLKTELCGYNGHCSTNLVVEGNGNCYPCDFYCEDEYLLGNINENDLEDLALSENSTKFVNQSLKVEEECRNCSVAYICMGGCRRERDDRGSITLNRYCQGKKKLFEYILKELR